MPGITVVAGPLARSRDPGDALARGEGYTTETCVAARGLAVLATRYPGYPIARWDDHRFTIVLEGRVYDATPAEVERELRALALALFDEPPATSRAAAFAARDGEFVAVLVDRTAAAAVVVTDRHGRLPLYRRTDGDGEVVSRDLSFVARGERPAPLRPMGVAEFLLFGFPLGDGTLFERVTRIPPASVLRLPDGALQASHPAHDFEDVDPADDLERAAAAIADGLVGACAARAAGRPAVLVSLSGGIDSRMVAGALRRSGVVPGGVTHAALAGGTSSDVAIAERVAARLGMPWELHPVPPATGAHVERLLALKGGANYVGMSPVLAFLDALRARHGSDAVLFTGDLGDRLLGDRTPAARLYDVRDLAEYLLRRETILGPDVVAALTGCPRTRLVDAVVARLEAYPERGLAGKHVHFLFAERAVRWVYEGEDRNRCFLWHTTPFYAPAVFGRATRVPPAQKRDERLRARVLALVAPEVAALENASTGRAPAAPAAAWQRRARRLGTSISFRTLGEDAERRLRAWLGRSDGHDAQSAVLRCIRAQLHGAGPVDTYLRPRAVERLLDDARIYRREQFSVVLTVTSLIDGLGGRPVLPAYRDVEMD